MSDLYAPGDLLSRGGHWLHNWVPLDAEALKEKHHGHVPPGAKVGHTKHGTGLPATPPGHMWVHNVTTGKPQLVTKAEAAAGHQRYGARTFRAGSPARGEVDRRALALAREAANVGRALTHEKAVMRMSDYDADGLDASWDGDHPDLPDLSGLDVPDFEAIDGAAPEADVARAASLGSGARFKALKGKLAAKGASNPGALAAYIGRKKYGKSRFAALAGKARKRKGGGSVSRGLVTRVCPLEDIHIVSRADGDGTGRVVEAYAAVFGQPVGIRDGQGDYEEVIHPGAFNRILDHLRKSPGGLNRVKVLYNHGKTLDGSQAPEYQRPLATPLEIIPDSRGLLTRSEYKKTPLAEEVLDDIKAGRLTGQSFEGPDLQSDPPLRGPGDRYRRRGGARQRVTRMALGLLNYGPALYEAYPGAEFLGVRMTVIGSDEGQFTGDEDEFPGPDGELTGVTPEEVIPSRSHAHRLWQIHYEDMASQAGIIRRG